MQNYKWNSTAKNKILSNAFDYSSTSYCFLSLPIYAVINKTALFNTVITPNKCTYSIKTAV